MKVVTRIQTKDGKIFNTKNEAVRYLEGELLKACVPISELLAHNNATDIKYNLAGCDFSRIVALQDEIRRGVVKEGWDDE